MSIQTKITRSETFIIEVKTDDPELALEVAKRIAGDWPTSEDQPNAWPNTIVDHLHLDDKVELAQNGDGKGAHD